MIVTTVGEVELERLDALAVLELIKVSSLFWRTSNPRTAPSTAQSTCQAPHRSSLHITKRRQLPPSNNNAERRIIPEQSCIQQQANTPDPSIP